MLNSEAAQHTTHTTELTAEKSPRLRSRRTPSGARPGFRPEITPASIEELARKTRFIKSGQAKYVLFAVTNIVMAVPGAQKWDIRYYIEGLHWMRQQADSKLGDNFGSPKHNGLKLLERMCKAYRLAAERPNRHTGLGRMRLLYACCSKTVDGLRVFIDQHPELWLNEDEACGIGNYPGLSHFKPEKNPLFKPWDEGDTARCNWNLR